MFQDGSYQNSINQCLTDFIKLKKIYDQQQGTRDKQRQIQQESQEVQIIEIDNDNDSDHKQNQESSLQLIEKSISDEPLQKGKIFTKDQLKDYQVFNYSKEPKRYKNFLQIISNKVTRLLCIKDQKIIVFQNNKKDQFTIKSVKPLERLFQIQVDYDNKKQVVLVFINSQQNQFSSPLIKKINIKDRTYFLQWLQINLQLEINNIQQQNSATKEEISPKDQKQQEELPLIIKDEHIYEQISSTDDIFTIL